MPLKTDVIYKNKTINVMSLKNDDFYKKIASLITLQTDDFYKN